MIARRTKIQLIVFVLITMVGVAFVGARYAKLDRLILDDAYEVVAHFEESGGIFQGAEVSYRGVTVGEVSDMELTDQGVDVVLSIQKDSRRIPAKARALVANRSAVGEQFVDLLPEDDGSPYLEEGSEIPTEMTATPISTTKFLSDISTTVESVNKQSLRTVVDEFGKAFKGTGENLGQIIDTSNSFIRTANDNFKITTALLEDSNVVLSTQLDKASAIRSFSADLSKFSQTMADSDADLRRVIESGSATANQLRTFLEENDVDLGQLINNLVTTGEVTGRHIEGTEMILVTYPYVVSGGYTVVSKNTNGLYDAHFGMILTQDPHVCEKGYESTDRRGPLDTGNRPMNERAHCAEPQAQSNARGAQHSPRGRAGASYRPPVVGAYDAESGTVEFTDRPPGSSVTYSGGAAAMLGEESWKWLLLQPLARQH